MLMECINSGEMSTTMKQGVISLIAKPDKDPNILENWRPISLLTIDYKLITSVFANRLRKGLNNIISEYHTGFLKDRHITNNTRLVLDLLDYAENVEDGAIILFFIFFKAFDTVEHKFLFKTIALFGFGNNFLNIVKMFYTDISSVIFNTSTTKRFNINRGVRQGCPISPFLFLLVVELLSIGIVNNYEIQGLKIFDNVLKISQLADDTTLFKKNVSFIPHAISFINTFSRASGLTLNLSKREILSLHTINDKYITNIPVKSSVKYLGIFVKFKKKLC